MSSAARGNRDAFDNYLSSLALFRKEVATDETSLFRAASEQIYSTQKFHDQLKECAQGYIDRHPEKFQHLNEIQACMYALAKLYRHDFLVYQEIMKPPVNMTNMGYPRKVILCESFGHHFDCVYPRTFQQKAAICQSVIYETLYKGVFHMDTEVAAAVCLVRRQNLRLYHPPSFGQTLPDTQMPPPGYLPSPQTDVERFRQPYPPPPMQNSYAPPQIVMSAAAPPCTPPRSGGGYRHQQIEAMQVSPSTPTGRPVSYYAGAPVMVCPRSAIIIEEEDEDVRNKEIEMLVTGPPFPYRVAKALDPVVYRNIEYDLWLDDKKARLRAMHPSLQGCPFPPGSTCFVRLDSSDSLPYYGIVQEVDQSAEIAVVFVPQLNVGEKMIHVQLDRLEGAPRTPLNAMEADQTPPRYYRSRARTWTSESRNGNTAAAPYSWPSTTPSNTPRSCKNQMTPSTQMQLPSSSSSYRGIVEENNSMTVECSPPEASPTRQRGAPVTVVQSPIRYPLMAQARIVSAVSNPPPPPSIPNEVEQNIRWQQSVVPASLQMQSSPRSMDPSMQQQVAGPYSVPVQAGRQPTMEDMNTLQQFYRLGGCDYFRQFLAQEHQRLSGQTTPQALRSPTLGASPQQLFPPGAAMSMSMAPMPFQPPSQ